MAREFGVAKTRVVKSEGEVVLTERILFGGEPRKRVGTEYNVATPKKPEGKTFEKVEDAARYFHIQVSLSSRRSPLRKD
jgi:hypothetical protein